MSSNLSNLGKYLTHDRTAVIYTLDATDLVQESMERVGCWPPATKHLGQGMMAALLLLAVSDKEDSLALQWNCDGEFGHLFTEAKNYGEARGTIQNPRPAGIADYETGLGQGILQVRRGKGSLSTTSVVKSTGDVSLDVVEFLEKSEQRNCGVNFSVLIDWNQDPEAKSKFQVKSALAYLVHIMPQNSEARLNEILFHWDSHMRALGPISTWKLGDNLTLGMARFLTAEAAPEELMRQRVRFHCNCSKERAARALTLLDKNDSTPAEEAETFEITCEYCGKIYEIHPKGE